MNLENNDEILERCLNDLNIGILNKPEFNSRTIQKVYELSNRKIKLLKPEDLRLLIGQNIGLKFLVPIALGILEDNPFIETELFEGDLLIKVLNVGRDFWEFYPNLKSRLIVLIRGNLSGLDTLDDELKKNIYQLYEELV